MKQSQVMILVVLFAFLIGWSTSVSSQYPPRFGSPGERGPFKPTWEELSMLPDYCYARALPDQHISTRRWAVGFGSMWPHIHHYCEALRLINTLRYSGSLMDGGHRAFQWGRVIAEIDYCLQYADRRFPLLTEMLANRQMAENEQMLANMAK